MNLSGLNPFQERQKIKIFGERNSATSYLEWLLRENLKVELLDYYHFGWKHRLAPSAFELADKKTDEVLFICLFKNPYSWLLSLHRHPIKHEELKKLSFSEFIRFPFGDYANPVELWNKKNVSYLALKHNVSKHHVIIYEQLLANPQAELQKLIDVFDLKKGFSWFNDQIYYISHQHGIMEKRFHKNYYLHQKWEAEYSEKDLDFIAQFLDTNLVQSLGYELLKK